jgi:hypothetical protein
MEKKDLPVYKIIIPNEETEEFGVKVISIVDEPAIEEDFIYLNKTQQFKFDTDKKILLGPLLIPDKKIYRYSEELGEYYIIFEKDTIETIVKKFNKEGNHNNLNFQHNSGELVNGYLTENWIIENDMDKAYYYKFNNLPIGTWMGKIYIDDQPFWDDVVKTGIVKGFSVELFAGIEQLLTKIDDQCSIDGKCGCKKGCGHTDEDLDYLEEVMIRAELLKHQYQQDLDNGLLKFRRVKWERWKASADCLTCPICRQLHLLGWQIQGTFFTYRWGSNQKEVRMPRYRRAHSEIGEGRWKAPDNSCRCVKDSFVTDATNPNLPTIEPLPPCFENE